MSFQKPENALRRAEELLGIGQADHALEVLHHTISNRRFRTPQWDIVQEQIMMQYVSLCVDLQKLKVAREGLHQYRTIVQTSNAQSLGKVLREIRDKAEDKLTQAKKKAEDVQLMDISEDLESEETPESLMLSMLAIDVRDQKAKEVHSALRMCWECYKMILDILRTTPKQEKIYHETAQRGLEFCCVNSRPQEFRRLCDVIRNHYSLLLKHRGKPEYEPLLRQEIHLETRLEQLKFASQLELWRESYQTAEDIHSLGIHEQLLVHKSSPPAVRSKIYASIAMYYEKLAEMFQVSDLPLFHAQARLRLLLHTRIFNNAQSDESLRAMASIAVLAVMVIPLNEHKKLENPVQLENYRKFSLLLNHHQVPTRDSLRHVLNTRKILELSAEPVQTLYRSVENEEINPVDLCEKCFPLLEDIALSPQLTPYVCHLKKVIFHKLIIKLAEVYRSMSVEYFASNICPEKFMPWSEAEAVVVGLVHNGALQLRLDYAKNAIYFDGTSLAPESIIRRKISSFGQQLSEAVRIIDATHRKEKQLERRSEFYEGIETKFDVEIKRLAERNNKLRSRREKQLAAIRRLEDAKRRLEKEKQEQEEVQEQRRRVDEQKRREEHRKKAELAKVKIAAAESIVEELKNMAATASRISGKTREEDYRELTIRGMPLCVLDVDRVIAGLVNLEDFEKLTEEIRQRERQEKVSIRKQQAKRVDHLVRALLEEELPFIEEFEQQQEKGDTEYLRMSREKKAEEHKVEKQSFMAFKKFKDDFVMLSMRGRREVYAAKRMEQVERLTKQLKDDKIARAVTRQKARHEALLTEKKEREEREQAKQEAAQQAAREEKKRKENDERERKLKEQQDKQREKEREIEEKQQQERQQRDVTLRTSSTRGGTRHMGRDEFDDRDWNKLRMKKSPQPVHLTDEPRGDSISGGGMRRPGMGEGAPVSSRAEGLLDVDLPPRRECLASHRPPRGGGSAGIASGRSDVPSTWSRRDG